MTMGQRVAAGRGEVEACRDVRGARGEARCLRDEKSFHAATLLLGKLNEIVPGRAHGRRGQGAEDKAPRTVSEVMNSRQTRETASAQHQGRTPRTILARWAQRRCQDPETPHQVEHHKGNPERGARNISLTPSQTIPATVDWSSVLLFAS